jgi:acetyltransferase
LKISIRPVRPEDECGLGEFFRNLSDRSRQRRFHGGLNELPPDLLAHFARPDNAAEMALVAVAVCGGREALIGEARYVVSSNNTRDAEIAIAVADAAQGRGLGKRLLRGLLRRAADNRIARLHGDVLPDNGAMLALASAFGFRQRRDPTDARLLLVERSL